MRIGFLSDRTADEAGPALSARSVAGMARAEIAMPPPLPNSMPPFGPEMVRVSREKSAFERAFEPSPVSPIDSLVHDVSAFRDGVAKKLYEQSKDYQMLCSLAHSGFAACEELGQELRRRLTGNPHYEVLRKLDEAHMIASLAQTH